MGQNSYNFLADLNIFLLIEIQHLDQLKEMFVVYCLWPLEGSFLDENLQLCDEVPRAEA